MTNRSLGIDRASSRRILARILDEPSLVATVQNLPPRALGKLINHIGLEDSGEIVALATTEQLKRIFEDDLWRSDGPGHDEAFDADRFTLWLEVMLEAGEDFVAERLLELPEDLVTLAIHRQVLVLNVDRQLESGDSEGEALIDKAFANCLHEEVDEYQLISRHHEGWGAIVSVLTTLDKHDHAFVSRVLERCCHMSSEYIEDNGGLYSVLTAEETFESDVAGEREDRRAGEGFIAPSQAASFLALCRAVPTKDILAAPRDAVTRAYFRDLEPAKQSETVDPVRALPAPGTATDRTAALEQMLAELDLDPLAADTRPVFLLEGGSHGGAPEAAIFQRALAALHEQDPKGHARTMEELAYLTNVLLSGCHLGDRSFRPFEAVVAVAAICNLGLEELATGAKGSRSFDRRASELLGREGADKVFRVGYGLLHQSVALATCDAVAGAFAASAEGASHVERRHAYERAARFLREKRAQGKPAFVRNRLTDLPVAEGALAVLEGLLSECPMLVGPVAIRGPGRYELDGERQLVATRGDLERIRAFLDALGAPEPDEA